MKQVVFILFSLFLRFGVAQTFMSETKFNLGEVSKLNQDVIDIELENVSSKDVYMLRINKPNGISIKHTSKQIKIGQKQTVRIKLNPKRKGKLTQSIQLYFSTNNKPIELKLEANILALQKNRLQDCPDFRNSKTATIAPRQDVALIKKYFVKLTDEEIPEPNIYIEPEKKELSKVIKPKRAKINDRRNQPSLHTKLFGKNDTKKDSVSKAKETAIVKIPTTNSSLLNKNYKPNNIVFLIDASTSMREEEKMETLKANMITLLEVLREIDYLSIVTYSGEAKVLLPPTKGVEKEAIKEKINKIEAEGSTNAVKGIKKAISIGENAFIENGNNQIILATDGAFDIGERNQSLRKKIKQTANKGLSISVLGIKNDKWTNKSLKEIQTLGQGSFIRLSKVEQKDKLLDFVKQQSMKP